MIAHSSGKDGDYLRIRRHLGSEEDYRDEHEQRTEHIHKVRHKVHVIVKDDGPQGRLVGHELVYLLAYVKYDHYNDDKDHRYEEGGHKLLEDIPVQFLWPQVYHNLCITRLTVLSFHCTKSPSRICLRAWRTRSR